MLFEFHPLKESDLPLLADWLSRPHLQEWWRSGEITLESVREKYLPRILGKDDAQPYLAKLDDVLIGYIQYYDTLAGDPAWWPDKPGPGVLGIDQFIGDEKNLNKGIGTAMIIQFLKLLMKDPGVKEIRVDPRPDNLRAIHCYEKVGFQKSDEIKTPDGPALMMTLQSQYFREKHMLQI